MSIAQEPLVLTPALAGTLMTPEEFDAASQAEEGYRYEVIRGVLVVTPPPDAGERGPNELLGHLIWAYALSLPGRDADCCSLSENFVRTSHRRRADRVIWLGLGRLPRSREDLPSIVVEFVSEGRRNRLRDYEEKRDEYLAAGIQEYWIIDRFRRRMTVYASARPAEAKIIAEEREYETTLMPGFRLPLASLFAFGASLAGQ
jgi:Uma2 family endonuclease